MFGTWTFGQKLGGGFALTVLCTLIISAIAIHALDSVVVSKDRVIATNAANLIDSARVDAAVESSVSSARGYLLSKDDASLQRSRVAREEAQAAFGRLKSRSTAQERQAIEEVERLELDYQTASANIIAQRRSGATAEALVRPFEEEAVPRRRALAQSVDRLVALQEKLMEDAGKAATAQASTASSLLIGITLACLLLAASTALFLTRGLASQIGSAVHHIQSSSSELQAAAGQQASSSREHASALTEITTTIRELLSTSRQIAESAERVSRIAEETAGGARTGDATVQRAQEALAASKGQVDLIVNQMLDLGRKSHQVGGVLDIINELADQTNILAINATIEAAGAGEAGRRFAVVADEIRKLADRVARSTREIRGLVDDIRASVNTTVMTTESGAKSVDAGTRQFGDVIMAFRQIVSRIQITTDAAREIELSTKQQSTAVDQVNLAVTQAAQAARESEASATQTLQTSSELAGLSRKLATIVQPGAATM